MPSERSRRTSPPASRSIRRTSQSSAGPDAEIVEDRQPQVAADRPQSIGDGAGDLGALGVAGGIEALDEQRQLLERVVVDVGRDARPFRLGRGDDQVALELRPRREPGERPDREPTRDQDQPEPQGEREEVRTRVGGEGDERGGAGDRELGRLEEAAARGAAAPKRPPGWIGPAAASPGSAGSPRRAPSARHPSPTTAP